MSYLKNLMSSVGVNPPPNQAPSTSSPITPKSPGLTNRAAVHRAVVANGNTPVSAPKRKASSDVVSAPSSKAPRTDAQPNGVPRYTGTSRPTSIPPVARPLSTAPDSLPYRRTSKPAVAVPSTAKPNLKLSNGNPKPGTAASKPPAKPPTPTASAGSPGTTSSTSGSVAPKKMSYQAMLARAKAAQLQAPVIGAIKHKQTEKLSKKDLLAQKEEARKQALANKEKPKAAVGNMQQLGTKAGEIGKDKVKPPAPAYNGTMRPKTAEKPAYSGTMRAGPVTRPLRPPPGRSAAFGGARRAGERPSSAGYDRYADEEEGEEEEEEDDYASDGSSDMEAGAFDVDEEEQFSLRQARREDDEAAREEADLKRQKQLRMQKLIADQAKRKKRY